MSGSSAREVWVTGVGAISAAGVGAARLRGALRRESSCVRPIAALAGLPAAAVEFTPGPAARHLDRSGAMFLAAAEEAWGHAGLQAPIPSAVRSSRGGR